MGLSAAQRIGSVELEARLPTLEAPGLRLRWLTERDVPGLFAIFSDPEVTRYWSSPPMKSVEEAETLLRGIHDCFANRSLFQWGVVSRDDDALLGTCTLSHLDPGNRRCEIGYALGRAHWGRGWARQAVTRAIDFAFEGLELHRIEADVDPRNAASLKLLDRLGFVREGYLSERYFIGGEVQDAVILGLLRPRWRRSPA